MTILDKGKALRSLPKTPVLLRSLSDEQWERRGQHPYFGETTVLTQAVNNAIHDLDHIEQIALALGKIEVWE